ncbi:Plant self-incompatibility S1 [Dillenia turbinata]|uniref:S-protein homolog n=1 Tax=Dillenia turbinata TaxID=194707 RepID=A0AAN8UF09_9MAGN
MQPYRTTILLLLLGLLGECRAGLLPKKASVSIINQMGSGIVLTVHCKSGDDDLGDHLLQQNEEYGFRFRPSFWGNTLYFCSFKWWDQFKYFDVYIYKRHDCRICKYVALQEGLCRFRESSGQYDTCYPWNSSK